MARDIREEMLEAAQAADEAAASRPIGECVRLLQCFECKTLEEFPDFPATGNPNDDSTLHYVDEKHGGHSEMPHHRAVHRVERRVWDDRPARRQIVDQMWTDVKGFTPSYYDIKNNLMEDAVKCHVAHNRQVPCIDFKDGSKRLSNPTRSMRERLARDMPRSFGGDRDAIAKGGPTQYLCDFCPVKVAVDFAKRQARGEA